VADGGIAAASNEAAQPASEKATPEADNPAPKPVRDLAARAGAKQNSLFGGKGKKIPTVGGVVILDGNGNLVGGDMATIGTDPGPLHAEAQAYRYANQWLLNKAVPGENYIVSIVAENRPCLGYCNFNLDTWSYGLSEAAKLNGANADLQVWWHASSGTLWLYYG
jgi:hypothetical protein